MKVAFDTTDLLYFMNWTFDSVRCLDFVEQKMAVNFVQAKNGVSF